MCFQTLCTVAKLSLDVMTEVCPKHAQKPPLWNKWLDRLRNCVVPEEWSVCIQLCC